MIILFSVILLLAVAAIFYIRQAKFGKAPSGKRLEQIQKSPNYKNGKFQNIHFTPTLTKGYSMSGVLYKFLFKKSPRLRPTDNIPSVKTDLLKIPIDSNVLVWFGHSSYFMQLNGKRFLIDPVFSGNASPIPNSNTSFKGSDIYTVNDLPEIDYLLITHDHYDHLDYETILQLKNKTNLVICGLGVGEHFEYWGYDAKKIIEKDWNETVSLENDIRLHTAPARHFSGRSFTRDNTLWLSYIIETPNKKIYVGGDSGYDTHFADIGKKFEAFDLVILDNGQYHEAWRAIHMFPEDVLKAANELNAKCLFPVHSSKFALALHAWDTSLNEISEKNKTAQIPLVTPVIGELTDLNNTNQEFKQWWKELK